MYEIFCFQRFPIPSEFITNVSFYDCRYFNIFFDLLELESCVLILKERDKK